MLTWSIWASANAPTFPPHTAPPVMPAECQCQCSRVLVPGPAGQGASRVGRQGRAAQPGSRPVWHVVSAGDHATTGTELRRVPGAPVGPVPPGVPLPVPGLRPQFPGGSPRAGRCSGPPSMCPTSAGPTAPGGGGRPVSRRARGSVWALIKPALVMNELVRRVCMTMELPNYGFALITRSPLHAISMCRGGQGSRGCALAPPQRPPQRPPCPRLAPAAPCPGLRATVQAEAAGGGSPSPVTTSACLGATGPGTKVLGTLPRGAHSTGPLSAPWHTQSPVPGQSWVPTEPHSPPRPSVPAGPVPSWAAPCQQHYIGRGSHPGHRTVGDCGVGWGFPQPSLALGWGGGEQNWPHTPRLSLGSWAREAKRLSWLSFN